MSRTKVISKLSTGVFNALGITTAAVVFALGVHHYYTQAAVRGDQVYSAYNDIHARRTKVLPFRVRR